MANLKSVLKCWAEFNLPALQKTLDQTATETVNRQDEAEKAKKHLIELLKEWRKNADEDVRTKVNTPASRNILMDMVKIGIVVLCVYIFAGVVCLTPA